MSEPTIGEAPNSEEAADTGSAGSSEGSRLTVGTSRASSGRSEAQEPDVLPGAEPGAHQYAPPPFPGGSVFALEEALSDGDDEAAKEDDPTAAEGFPPAADDDFGVMDMQASFVELLPELLSMARYSLLPPEEGATATNASAGVSGREEPDNRSNGKAPMQSHEEAFGQLLTLTERLSILPMQISVPPPEPEAPRAGQAGTSSFKPAAPRPGNEIPLQTIDSTNLPEMSVLLQLLPTLPATGSFISLPSQSCNLDLPAPALHAAAAGPGPGAGPSGAQGQQGHAGAASQPQSPYFAHRAPGTLSGSQPQPLAPPSVLYPHLGPPPSALGPAPAGPAPPPTAAAMLADLQRVFESHGLPPSEAMQLARSAAAAAVPVAGGPSPAPAAAPVPGPAAPGPGPGMLEATGGAQPPSMLAPHAAPGVVTASGQQPQQQPQQQQQQQQPSMSAKQLAAQALIALLARKAPGFAASAAAAAAAATANARAAPAASSSGAAAPGGLPGSCLSGLTASTAAAAHPACSEAHGPAASEVTATATTNERGPNDHIGGIGATSKKRRAGAASPALMAGLRHGGSGGGGGGESSGNDAEGEAPAAGAGQKLPEPVGVYVSGLTREGEQVTVEGVFHPDLYMAGQDCIWFQEQFVSRSAFEKAGHATANKWHCSIKVANSKHALGTWLTERGLPVLKGVPRRSRQQRVGYPAPPSGPGPGGAAAAVQPAGGLNVLPVLAAALALRNNNAAAAAGAAPALGPGMLQWPAAATAVPGSRSFARFHSLNASGSSIACPLAPPTAAAISGLGMAPSPAPGAGPPPANIQLTHHHRHAHSSCQLDDTTDTTDQPPVAPYFRVPSTHAHGNASWGPTQGSLPSPALHAPGPGPGPASGCAAYLPGPMGPPLTSPPPGHLGGGTWPDHGPVCTSGWQQQGQHGEGQGQGQQGLVPGALGTGAPDPFASAPPVDKVPSVGGSAAGGYGGPVAGAFGGGDWRAASGRSSGTLRSGGGLLGAGGVSFRSDLDPCSPGLGSYHGSCSPALHHHQQQQHNFTIGTANPPLQPRSVAAMRRNAHLRASMPVERYGGGGSGVPSAGGAFGSAGPGAAAGAREGDSSFGHGSLGVGAGALSGGMGRAGSLPQQWPLQGAAGAGVFGQGADVGLGVGPLGMGAGAGAGGAQGGVDGF